MVSPSAYQGIELAVEGRLDRVHELLPVSAHGDVADGDGDTQPLLGPQPAALLQVRRAAGARVHPCAEPGQPLHDRVPDPLAASGDQRCRAGQAPPFSADRRCHSLFFLSVSCVFNVN